MANNATALQTTTAVVAIRLRSVFFFFSAYRRRLRRLSVWLTSRLAVDLEAVPV